jgi:hypothetical protein
MWGEIVAPKPLPAASWLRCEQNQALTAVNLDSLLVFVALASSMRLSLMKAAHVAVSRVAWQVIRVMRVSPAPAE